MAAPGGVPTASIAAGETLHRVHGEHRAARWYGRRDATSRWDDAQGDYGVLYLGKSPIGAFAEALLRAPTDRDVLISRVRQKRFAVFKTVRRLNLAKLHGEGLAWFGVTASDIADSDYGVPQKLSNRVHGAVPVDGIQYRSRFDNDELCVALFERADDAIALVSEGEPIDRNWTTAVLAARGYRLVEL